jgi:hypothetical protein
MLAQDEHVQVALEELLDRSDEAVGYIRTIRPRHDARRSRKR